MSVRETTFTLRIEPALRRMAEQGKGVRVAAYQAGVPIADVRLWLFEFNEGRESLTLERIQAVKRELGIISERKLEPGELATKPEKAPEVLPQRSAEAAKTDSARNVVVVGGNRLGKSAMAAQLAAAGRVWPWHTKNRKMAEQAAVRWMPVLELYRPPAPWPGGKHTIGKRVREIGGTMGAWNQFKLAYFGSGGFTAEAVEAFIAAFPVVQALADRGVKVVPPPAAVSPVVVPLPEVAVDVLQAMDPRPERVKKQVSFDEAVVEVENLARVYRENGEKGWSRNYIKRGLCDAILDAAVLAGKEGV